MKLTLQLWACHASMTDWGLLCPGAVMCCVAVLAALSVSIEAEQKYAAQPLARNDDTPSH